MTFTTTTDLTRGVYRRIYAGARTGKRINQVSIEAELLFWRLHCVADDFGNLAGDTYLVRIEAVPLRREWDDAKVGNLLDELASIDPKRSLIRFYDADGERYIHISGFIQRQPGNRSGRRIRKYPASPFEDEELAASGNAGESGEVLRNPGEPSAPQNQTQNQSESESLNQTQNHGESNDQYQDQVQRQHVNVNGNSDVQGGISTPKSVGDSFYQSGDGGVGGLGPTLQRSLGPDLKRQLDVQSLLAKFGVIGNVQRELYQRNDITPAIVQREIASIQRNKDVEDPAAVLVHRLRNYRR